ncbi:MAG: hypothetical protein KKH75_06940 [Actinobacteria bacterium]|nr:hypothetical protein [Actinomycetota bacterium]
MRAEQVVDLVEGLAAAGVVVWVDGGWCVDALVGRQLRSHADLDLAVDRNDEPRFLEWIRERGFAPIHRAGTSAWEYSLTDAGRAVVDVRVFGFDAAGSHIYGMDYPPGALGGTGTIDGTQVRCMTPKWMFRFALAAPTTPKHLADVRALHETYGFALPPSHTGTSAEPRPPAALKNPRRSVLFVGEHDAGRSQMAAGYLSALSDGRIGARSAGSEPAGAIDPLAVEVMAEAGIDISTGSPAALTVDDVRAADVIITMGCGDACPILPGKRYEEWVIADPRGQPIDLVRGIRDQIRARVQVLVDDLLED